MTPFATFVTVPVLFGKSPTMTGVLPLYSVNDDVEAVIVRGAPDEMLRMPPSCHRSTSRCTSPGALLRKRWFCPNGSSYIPLLRKSWVRWKLNSVLFSDRFLGSK